MRITIVFVIMVALAMTSVSWALEDGLGVNVNTSWYSKYIWRGFDKLDDKGVFMADATLDLYGTGFTFGLTYAFADSSGTTRIQDGGASRVNAEEMRYTLAYHNSIYEGETYKTNYMVGWVYYDFPEMASKNADFQEMLVSLSWPEICPAGVVPSYTIVKIWPAKGGGGARAVGGFAHIFGLAYDYTIPDMPELPLKLTMEAVYNDGCGAGGAGPGRI